MTYVNENTRVFLDEKFVKAPLKRRSEGRLKTYGSTEDVRAWNLTVEDRRQHILEVVNSDVDKSNGSLIQEILISLKSKYLNDLKKCCRIVWRFLNLLPLSSDDKNKIKCLEVQLGIFFKQVISGCVCAGDFGLICGCGMKGVPCTCGDPYCICEKGGSESSGTYKVKAAGPVRLVTKVRGIKPGLEIPCESLVVKAQCPSKVVSVIRNVRPSGQSSSARSDRSTASCSNANCPARDKDAPSSKNNQSVVKNVFPSGQSSSARPDRSTTVCSNSNCPARDKKATPSKNNQYVYSLFETSKGITRLKRPTVGLLTESDNSFKKLQDALEERKFICEEQQKHIESLKSERETLNCRIHECLKELKHLKKINNASPPLKKVSSTSGFDEDQSKLREELKALKKYCWQLRETEAENEKLKMERDLLKRQLQGTPVSTSSKEGLESEILKEVKNERDILRNKVKLLEEQLRPVAGDLELYKDRSAMLDNTLAERDAMLRTLDNIKDMEAELETLQKKAERVDELEIALKSLKYDKTSDYDLRRVQSQCMVLERELENMKTEKESLQRRIDFLTSELECLKGKAKEAEILKLERDRLQIKVNDLTHVQIHNENLMVKCKTLESASQEGYMYRQKYEELLVMECECQTWKAQLEAAEHVKRDRDSLRRQVTDLQSVILEQENEIKKLMSKCESVAKFKDETQIRLREALHNMRNEVERKDSIIAASEEKLEQIQMELKSSIQGVSCDAICQKTRLEELEQELENAKKEIKKLEDKIKENRNDAFECQPKISKSEYCSLAAMRRELDAAKAENKKLQEIAKKMVSLTGDEHVQDMLKHSESAIRKVVAELSKQYKEWDHYKKERRRSRSRSYESQKSSFFQESETAPIGDLQGVQKETVALKNNLQVLKSSGICPGELISLKLRNTQLLEKLQEHS